MYSFYSIIFLSLFLLQLSTAVDKITVTKFLNDPETIVSKNGAFELGFFSPPNSKNRYVGIWYNKLPENHVVWVANRKNPLNKSSSGAIRISKDGNLQILNAQNDTVWSSNVSVTTNQIHSMPEAQLLDSGNLVLIGLEGRILW